MNKSTTIFCGILLVMGAFLIINVMPNVSATTLEVGPGKTYSDIQSAYNAASDNDIINVYYDSTPYTECLTIQKAVSIIGISSGGVKPIVSGSNNNEAIFKIVQDNKCIHISNFDIDGNGINTAAGVYSTATPGDSLNIKIDNCIIHDFVGYGSGIRLDGGNYHWIYDNVIYNNYDGIFIESDPGYGTINNFVEDCEIFQNQDNGIFNHGDENCFENIISHNNTYGIQLYESDMCTIGTGLGSTSEYYYNEKGIYARYCDDLTIIGYSDDDYLYQVFVYQNTVHGIDLLQCPDCQISYVTTYGNGDGDGDGLYGDECNDFRMDHVIFYDGMDLYDCDGCVISYYTILSVYWDVNCNPAPSFSNPL